MGRKVALVCDPGIDGAFAVALALHDPTFETVGLLATAGNVSAERATQNVQILVEHFDPPRLPRIGAAPTIEYDVDGSEIHGPSGLGGTDFPCAPLHHVVTSDKLLVDLLRQHPNELTILCLGPLTVVARALDMNPELPGLVQRIICVGGSLHEPGNAGPVSEFHFYCDPPAASQVLNCGAPITLIPLDLMRKVLFSPTDLLNIPTDCTPSCRFLRQIVPYGIAAMANAYGIEGFHLKDVLGVFAAAQPELIHTRSMRVDVETQGALTRGMSVFDQRPWKQNKPNVELAFEVDPAAVRKYMRQVLGF